MARVWLFLAVVMSCRAFGQETAKFPPDSVLAWPDLRDEKLFDQVLTEPENLEAVDNLQWLSEHPFDLNAVTAEELESIPGVTPAEALAFVTFRSLVRHFTSVDQVKVMENIGEVLFQKLAPFVIAGQASSEAQRVEADLRTRVSRDLQPRRGFLDSSYAGSSLKSYNRMMVAAANVQMGGLFEKDPGERTSTGFLSGYVRMDDALIFSRLIVGDYVVEAGQGLVLWRASAFGKGSEITAARKSGLGALPYRSSDEVNFLRGLAALSRIPIGRTELSATAFLSRRSLDGSVNAGGDLTSLYPSGLFRTASELQRRRVAREDLVGGRVQLVSPEGWNLGGTLTHSTFDRTVVSDHTFDFTGRSATLFGIDGSVRLERLSVFGEVARSGDRASAVLAGGTVAMSSSVTAVIVYRDYAAGFNNFHAQGFGESDNTKNERGLYLGLHARPARWLFVTGYLDQFKFPWRTFDNPLPARGHDMLLESSADVSRALHVSVRYSAKSVETTEPGLDSFLRETRLMMTREQYKIRATASYAVSRRIRVRGRVETTGVSFAAAGRKERGYLFYHDVRYTSPAGFGIEGRLIFFDTDSYESRLYEYENDLRGVFSNPALYGKGRRWYLLIRCELFDALTLSAKYQQTEKEDVVSIGSGDAEIPGNIDNRLALQLDVRW